MRCVSTNVGHLLFKTFFRHANHGGVGSEYPNGRKEGLLKDGLKGRKWELRREGQEWKERSGEGCRIPNLRKTW